MFVYVQGRDGQALMPTQRLGKVRRWLASGRAVIVRREPFTIRLLDVADGYTQPLKAGIDQGTAHVGVSVVSETAELFAGEFRLRMDIAERLTERRTYRRARRGRKVRHRAPRFNNRRRTEKLTPSLRAKVEESRKAFDLIGSILPISEWHIEVGNFDPHKLVNPAVEGVGYQQGEQAGFYNTREYVLWRDGHTCQGCQDKHRDPILQVHHLVPQKQGGSARPDNLITLCRMCHQAHHHGTPLHLKAPPSFRAPSQFNVLKTYLLREVANLRPHCTFGYLTKARRIALKLPKSHVNDAFVIAGGSHQQRAAVTYLGVFARKQIRKQRKGARSHLRNTLPSAFGFKRGDRVRLADGRDGFIVGLRSSGYFDVQHLDGTVLHHSAKYTTLCRLESAATLRVERSLAKGDSASALA